MTATRLSRAEPVSDDDARADLVEIELDGDIVSARLGEPVATALIAADHVLFGRSVKYHRPRGAFCLQGACGSCLVRIDGQPNVRACRTAVAAGMKIERQNSFPSATLDVFAATDFAFPRGMDHHTLMTGAPKPVHALMQKIARQLAGLGRLPDERETTIPAARTRHAQLVVVGAGPAGLSAATAVARTGTSVLVIDEGPGPGGSFLAEPRDGLLRVRQLVHAATAAGVEILNNATALAYYPEDRAPGTTKPGLLAVATQDGLLLVAAQRYLYATGSYDQNALFPDNDIPGIYSARAVGRLLARDAVLPSSRAAVLGAGPYARRLSEALARAGADVQRIDGIDEHIVAVHGRSRVRGVSVDKRNLGKEDKAKPRKLKCDFLAVAALPTPATELAREHGCEVRWESSLGGFHVVTDALGHTSVPGVFAAGDVTGFLGPEAAAEAGARIGAAIASDR